MPAIIYPSWGAIQACLKAPVFEYNGARRISTNVVWAPKTPPWVTEKQLSEIGYARPSTKLKALRRMYHDQNEANRVREMLEKRKGQAFSAIALSTIAGAKDSRSMGHCINSIVLSVTPKRCEATILYRSTELIKKFTADLAFFPWVFNQIGVSPTKVTFIFSNCFVSGVFFPTLMAFVDPIEFLDSLRLTEPPMFRVATRFLRRSVRTEKQVFPFSPEQMQHEFAWKHFPHRMEEIDAYLKKHAEVR